MSPATKWEHRWRLRPDVTCARWNRPSPSPWSVNTGSAGAASRTYGAPFRTGRTGARSGGVRWCTKSYRSTELWSRNDRPAVYGALKPAALRVRLTSILQPITSSLNIPDELRWRMFLSPYSIFLMYIRCLGDHNETNVYYFQVRGYLRQMFGGRECSKTSSEAGGGCVV